MALSITGRTEASGRTWLPLAILVPGCAVAWIVTVHSAQQMGNAPGTMGLDFGSFLVVWAVMMAAMMLPALSVVTVSPGTKLARLIATSSFALGYLAAWALAGCVAYLVALGFGSLARVTGPTPVVVGVGLFFVCAAYQMTRTKWRFLQECASPTAPVFPLAHTVQSGLRCGSRCLGASWALMSLLLALGLMNIAGMGVIAGALLVERRARRRAASVAIGVCALGFGIAISVHPGLAAGLVTSTSMPAMSMGRM